MPSSVHDMAGALLENFEFPRDCSADMSTEVGGGEGWLQPARHVNRLLGSGVLIPEKHFPMATKLCLYPSHAPSFAMERSVSSTFRSISFRTIRDEKFLTKQCNARRRRGRLFGWFVLMSAQQCANNADCFGSETSAQRPKLLHSIIYPPN